MKETKIRLANDGKVYKGDKHIATVAGGDIKFNHHAYKRHKDEIEHLVFGEMETEPVDIGLEPIDYTEPVTPLELFNTETGKWHGEEDPHVVTWRKANWSADAFSAKYDHQEELLLNNFARYGMNYNKL